MAVTNDQIQYSNIAHSSSQAISWNLGHTARCLPRAFSAVGSRSWKKTSNRFAKLLRVDRIDRTSVLCTDACERSNVAPCNVAPL